jgi:predicted chitinase
MNNKKVIIVFLIIAIMSTIILNNTDIFNKIKSIVKRLTPLQEKSINAILSEIKNQGIKDPKHIAYILATAWHESRFKPIIEWGGQAYLKSKAYYPYYGRGFVQLTWLSNYKKIQKIIEKTGRFPGVDILKKPSDLLRMDVAAFVIVYGMKHGVFSGKKLSDYDDFINMRRIVNKMDKAALIASYAEKLI